MKKTTYLLLAALVATSLSACGAAAEEEATPDAASLLNIAPVAVNATGEVIPANRSLLSFSTSGQVVEVLVQPGDVVSEGDVLARLDSAVLEADLESAKAGLALAEAQLEQARTGARSEQIEEARDNLAAASAGVAEAVGNRDDLQNGATEAEILDAQVQVQQAYLQFLSLRTERDYREDVLSHPEENNLFIRFVWTPDLVDDASKALEFQRQSVDAAQAYLDDLLDGPNPDQLRAVQAQVWAASAEYQAALANLALLENGPRAEDIAVAEAAVEQARAVVENAQIALDNATLVAPFDGTVALVNTRVGEYVNAGVPVIDFADLASLRVETNDLNEVDVARVTEGGTVFVTFDALPGVEVTGTVLSIAPKSSEGTGVNYKVVVALDEVPEGVRWGMTAFVDIAVD
ncbi:MAG: HlyD family efflux transporter periplasmic adaptor subunit [Anaerolineae bacterium]|nr:HlyD family efflux transporter periplasmic adaptor subunit [Anaerolineae bacterium]